MTRDTMNRSRRLLVTLLLVALPLTAAACGNDKKAASTGDGASSTTTTAAAAEKADFTLTESKYEDFSVAAGKDVYVQNDTGSAHTFTADDASFDSGTIAPGALGEAKAPSKAGAYPFHCEIHSSMKATLTVT
jgi:plastocyanin